MSPKLKSALLHSALVAAALLVAGVIVGLVVSSDKAYRKKVLEEEASKLRDIETTLLEAEERIAAGRSYVPVKEKLLAMDESFLGNDQVRRRLLLLGDIYLIQYKQAEEPGERKLLYDLAVRSFDRALSYCKAPGREPERNEIIRRLAELYAGNKDYAKALSLLAESRELQTLPTDRWRFKLIEADCLLNDKKPYAASVAFASIADESEDKKLLSEAAVRRGQLLIDVASDPALIALYLTKDGTLKGEAPSPAAIEEERKRLLSSAMADFEKTLAKSSSFDAAASEAKLGLLRIFVIRSDKVRAYEIVNAIQGSPMPMRSKAEALVSLAKLHEKLGEYKTAIKILETCSQNYPLSSMFVPVSLDLYDYYKKAGELAKAFAVSERIVMRGPDAETIKRLVDDFSPDAKQMISLLMDGPDKAHYTERFEAMLDKIRKTRPEAWKLVQNQANLILCFVLFNSGRYSQAERAVSSALLVSPLPKDMEDELLYLDMACAEEAGLSPAIVAARAKRYLQSFPVGRHYRDALEGLLDSFYQLGLYESALDVARKMYMDELTRRSKDGKPSRYWIKTVARIGECYAKLGNYDRANMILRDNAKAILAYSDPYEAYKIWAEIAESRGQSYEAMRRLDVAIPAIKDTAEKADLIVARYLLQLKDGGNRDFEAAKELLAKIESSEKIPAPERRRLARELSKGLLEYAFRAAPDSAQELLAQCLKSFGSESWMQYWTLLSLSKLFGKGALGSLSQEYEKTLASAPFAAQGSSEAASFMNKQISLIKNLEAIDANVTKLKSERGL